MEWKKIIFWIGGGRNPLGGEVWEPLTSEIVEKDRVWHANIDCAGYLDGSRLVNRKQTNSLRNETFLQDGRTSARFSKKPLTPQNFATGHL